MNRHPSTRHDMNHQKRDTLDHCLSKRSKGMNTIRKTLRCFLRSCLATLRSPGPLTFPNIRLRRFMAIPCREKGQQRYRRRNARRKENATSQ